MAYKLLFKGNEDLQRAILKNKIIITPLEIEISFCFWESVL